MTASKAIIEKEYQPHVIVSTAGPNPFTALTDRELEEYRREVERKQRGPGGGCARPGHDPRPSVAAPLCPSGDWVVRGTGPCRTDKPGVGSRLDVTERTRPPCSCWPVPGHVTRCACSG